MELELVQSLLLAYHLPNCDENDDDVEEMFMRLCGPKEVVGYAQVLKMNGNSLYKQGKLKSASETYRKAVKSICFATPTSKEGELLVKELAISLNLNLAACALKLCEFVQAVELCMLVLEFDDRNVKALFRRAIAYIGLNFYEDGYKDLVKASKIEPKNKEVRQEMTKVEPLMQSICNGGDDANEGCEKTEGLSKRQKLNCERQQENNVVLDTQGDSTKERCSSKKREIFQAQVAKNDEAKRPSYDPLSDEVRSDTGVNVKAPLSFDPLRMFHAEERLIDEGNAGWVNKNHEEHVMVAEKDNVAEGQNVEVFTIKRKEATQGEELVGNECERHPVKKRMSSLITNKTPTVSYGVAPTYENKSLASNLTYDDDMDTSCADSSSKEGLGNGEEESKMSSNRSCLTRTTSYDKFADNVNKEPMDVDEVASDEASSLGKCIFVHQRNRNRSMAISPSDLKKIMEGHAVQYHHPYSLCLLRVRALNPKNIILTEAPHDSCSREAAVSITDCSSMTTEGADRDLDKDVSLKEALSMEESSNGRTCNTNPGSYIPRDTISTIFEQCKSSTHQNDGSKCPNSLDHTPLVAFKATCRRRKYRVLIPFWRLKKVQKGREKSKMLIRRPQECRKERGNNESDKFLFCRSHGKRKADYDDYVWITQARKRHQSVACSVGYRDNKLVFEVCELESKAHAPTMGLRREHGLFDRSL